jgi:hypothetical protein
MEFLALIDERALPRALQIAPPVLNRLGRARTANAQTEGFAMAESW